VAQEEIQSNVQQMLKSSLWHRGVLWHIPSAQEKHVACNVMVPEELAQYTGSSK
jgi:hypothetical protein